MVKVDVERIKCLRSQGLSYREIGKQLNISTNTVRKYCSDVVRVKVKDDKENIILESEGKIEGLEKRIISLKQERDNLKIDFDKVVGEKDLLEKRLNDKKILLVDNRLNVFEKEKQGLIVDYEKKVADLKKGYDAKVSKWETNFNQRVSDIHGRVIVRNMFIVLLLVFFFLIVFPAVLIDYGII